MRSVYCKAISCIQHLHIMQSQLSRQADQKSQMTNDGVINTNYRATHLTQNHNHHFPQKASCSFPYMKVAGDEFLGEMSCIGSCSVNSQCKPSYLNE